MRIVLGDHWDNIKHINDRIIQVEGEKREQEIENLFEKIMTPNFPNLAKKTDIQVPEVWRLLHKMNPRRLTPRHIIIITPKVKDKEEIFFF